jgi:hypothetical protein
MNHLHEMLIEDEIVLCGLVLLLGLAAGAVARFAFSVWRRGIPRIH